MNLEKASHDSDIPTKLIKQNIDIFRDVLHSVFNNCLENATIPSISKTGDAIPVFQKDNMTDKNNYRLISILPNVSKIFETCMYQEISGSFEENIFSKCQCGLR